MSRWFLSSTIIRTSCMCIFLFFITLFRIISGKFSRLPPSRPYSCIVAVLGQFPHTYQYTYFYERRRAGKKEVNELVRDFWTSE